MILNEENRKPEIKYPCNWSYKIIGTDIEQMIAAVEETIVSLNYDLTPSNISRKGRYFSLNVTVMVPSEIVRDEIFKTLSGHPAIKFVM